MGRTARLREAPTAPYGGPGHIASTGWPLARCPAVCRGSAAWWAAGSRPRAPPSRIVGPSSPAHPRCRSCAASAQDGSPACRVCVPGREPPAAPRWAGAGVNMDGAAGSCPSRAWCRCTGSPRRRGGRDAAHGETAAGRPGRGRATEPRPAGTRAHGTAAACPGWASCRPAGPVCPGGAAAGPRVGRACGRPPRGWRRRGGDGHTRPGGLRWGRQPRRSSRSRGPAAVAAPREAGRAAPAPDLPQAPGPPP